MVQSLIAAPFQTGTDQNGSIFDGGIMNCVLVIDHENMI